MLSNGAAGCRPSPIEPERLKDFGEEHLLNGEVRALQTEAAEAPEVRLTEPPKTRRLSEFRATPKPQYLRFEDISAAAFGIQTGIQKTPCTVGGREPRLNGAGRGGAGRGEDDLRPVCAVLQAVQTVRDGDLPEEGATALHGIREGERGAVSAGVSHAGNQAERQRPRPRPPPSFSHVHQGTNGCCPPSRGSRGRA